MVGEKLLNAFSVAFLEADKGQALTGCDFNMGNLKFLGDTADSFEILWCDKSPCRNGNGEVCLGAFRQKIHSS